MNPRDYQIRALDGIAEKLAAHRSTLVVMPTGTGKTVLFATAIQKLCQRRTLVIAHREELIRQAAAILEGRA